jgi:hypothetical protein
LQGVEQALRSSPASENLNPELDVLVVLNTPTCAPGTRARRCRPQAALPLTFETVIRRSIAYAESSERAIPILDYRPDRVSTTYVWQRRSSSG